MRTEDASWKLLANRNVQKFEQIAEKNEKKTKRFIAH